MKGNSDSRIWRFYSDAPVLSAKEDRLDRREYAHRIACDILRYDKKDPLVIGLEGSWGAGKTSLKNMVIESLKQREKGGRNITLMEFTPWSFADDERMVDLFYNELSLSLAKKCGFFQKYYILLSFFQDGLIDCKKYIKDFVFYVGILSFLLVASFDSKNISLWIKFVVLLVSFAILLIDFVLLFFRVNSFFAASDVVKRKKKLVRLLRNKKELDKVVVVVDDIDRLDNEGILKTIRLVKSQADLDNFVFVLCYDRPIVENALKGIVGDNYKSIYLHKIVQAIYPVPAPDHDQVIEELQKNIEQLFSGIPQGPTPRKRDKCIFELLGMCVSNLRDVQRYMNSFYPVLISHLEGGKLNLEPAELMVLEGIRIFEKEVYIEIYESKSVLIESKTPTEIFETDEAKEKNSFREFKKRVERLASLKNLNFVNEAIHFLFAAQFGDPIEYYTVQMFEESPYTDCYTINNPVYFDSYFKLSMKDGFAPKFRIDELIECAEDKDKFKNYVYKLLSDYPNVFHQIYDATPQIEGSNATVSVFAAMLELDSEIGQSVTRFDQSYTEKIVRRVFESIHPDHYVQFLEKAVPLASNVDLVPSFLLLIERRSGESELLEKVKNKTYAKLGGTMAGQWENYYKKPYVKEMLILWPNELSDFCEQFQNNAPKLFLEKLLDIANGDDGGRVPYFNKTYLLRIMPREKWESFISDHSDIPGVEELKRDLKLS